MTQRDRIILSVIAVVAALGAYWFVLLGPKRAESGKLGTQVAAATQKRDAARAQVAAADGSRREYAANYAQVTRVGKAVPADDDPASLVYQLEGAAKRAGIDFRSIRIEGGGGAAPAAAAAGTTAAPGTATPAPGTQPGPGGLTQLPFKLVFEGTFANLRKFLRLTASFARMEGDRLQVRGRLLTLDGVGLTPSRSGLPRVKASIVASAYLAPESTALPVAGAAGATPGATPPAGAAPPTSTASAATPVASSTPASGATK